MRQRDGGTGPIQRSDAAPGAPAPAAGCVDCPLFIDDPGELETMFQGIGALSSAYGSTRGRAGICLRDGIFRDPSPPCSWLEARGRGGRP